jgi:hypothetical protein
MQLNSYNTLISLKLLVPSTKSPYLAVEKHFLTGLMAFYIEKIKFDEDWYLQQYPDIAEGLAVGAVESAQDHYLRFGYFEGRLPYEILVDEKWYLNTYPDILIAVKNRVIQSGQAHFIDTGYREGRLPYDGFSFEFAEAGQPELPAYPASAAPAPTTSARPAAKARTRK